MPADLPITDLKPREHRAGAWVVLIMGLIGLGLGVYQWRSSFKAAFVTKAGTFKTPEQIAAEQVSAMKTKDTDEDGLTDFEETYIYKTSPYLKDSDGDEADDAAELKAGEDPNCPKGKSCAALAGSISPQAASASSTAQIEEEALKQLMNPTAGQIRQMLLDQGVKKEELDGIDDATLLDLYKQSLIEAQAKSSSNTP